MAISLKKHTPGAGEQESSRLNDVNSNWGTIEQAINDLQANASLQGKLLTFRTTVAVPASTYSSSTGFHFAAAAIALPAGYTMTSSPVVLFTVQDGGLWITHVSGLASDRKSFFAYFGSGMTFAARNIIVSVLVSVV